MQVNKRITIFFNIKRKFWFFLRTIKPIPIAPRITMISTGDSFGVSGGQGVMGFSGGCPGSDTIQKHRGSGGKGTHRNITHISNRNRDDEDC